MNIYKKDEIDLVLLNKLIDLFIITIYKSNNNFIHPINESFINICKDKEDIEFIIPVLLYLQKNNPKPSNYTSHYYNTIMYITILYLYYSLVLGEQIDDFLNLKILNYIINKFCDNFYKSNNIFSLVKSLYFNICTSEEKLYYSTIRRYFFGMNSFIDLQ